MNVAEVLAVLSDTYQSMEILTTLVFDEAAKQGELLTLRIRFSHEEPDVVKQSFLQLESQYGQVNRPSIRVICRTEPFSNFSSLSKEMRDGIISDASALRLRKGVDLLSLPVVLDRSHRPWPMYYAEIQADRFSDKVLQVANSEKVYRDIELAGYSNRDAMFFHLLKMQTSNIPKGMIQFEIPAKIDHLQCRPKESRTVVMISILAHDKVADKVAAVLTPQGLNRRLEDYRANLRFATATTALPEGRIHKLTGSLDLPLDPEEWISLRLLCDPIGEVESQSGIVQEFIEGADRNPLETAFQIFCPEDRFRELLTDPILVDTKLPSRDFEWAISSLLSLCGFQSIDMGKFERAQEKTKSGRMQQVDHRTADILAYHARKRALLIVGCTLSPAHDEKVNYLQAFANRIAEEHFHHSSVRVIPVLFSADAHASVGERYSKFQISGVRIVGRDEIKNFLSLLHNGLDTKVADKLVEPPFFSG